MYSAWKISWVSGLCVISAGLIYTLISMVALLDFLGGAELLQMVGLSLIAFASYAVVITVAVRTGLRLAGSRYLSRRSAIAIPLAYLVVVALASSIPIRTHVVENSTMDSTVDSGMAAVTALVMIFDLVLLPIGISFIVGRRSHADRDAS